MENIAKLFAKNAGCVFHQYGLLYYNCGLEAPKGFSGPNILLHHLHKLLRSIVLK